MNDPGAVKPGGVKAGGVKPGGVKSGDAKPEGPLRTGLLHQSFGHLFRRAHLRSQQAFARAFDGSELSPLQYGILELVQLNPGIAHGALATGMVTAPSVVTAAMKPLLEARFLTRRTAGDDARRVDYTLTPGGEAFFGALRGQLLDAEALLLAPLNADDRASLNRILLRLAAVGRL
ncbi:MAG: MarR family winged helix-turn-helix transcriptional regulator [Kiloniellaceae bacterium]